MALTWLTKTKQYFTTKVFTEDRFRTGDKPTEAEYSNLFQSIVFKVHDLATTLLAGIVRKATKLDFLLGRDEKQTQISGYTHNEPLYVNPVLMQEFILPAGSIISWVPFRAFNRITGERFIDNAGTILDTGFQALRVGLTVSQVSANNAWYNASVIDYLHKYYLSPRYKICYGQVETIINPYTNLNETITLPDLRERVLRGGSDTLVGNNQRVFDFGGIDFQNLSHTHRISEIDLENALTITSTSILLDITNLPAHSHGYTYENTSLSSTPIQPGSGSPVAINNPTNNVASGTTSTVGGGLPFTHTHTIDATSDIVTSIEEPADVSFTDFSNVDNRQKYFNGYFIISIY